MNKSDKELAVELTVATIDMVTNHKMQSGTPSLEPLSQTEIKNLLNSYHSTIKDLDNS
ncbi:hypothetical protein [Mammaliicoccus sciuri]|uniref:hypothetical protein n=1 Tax=Mammaliicoccus sciuri TaxID=1296 RepID=UPI002B25C3C6|nr:hypothetical protein [Mammaliicoccus sciuri]WQK62778.1 hypothetical protein P3U20_11290 [Mammaliicoccus sciuri]